MGRHLAGISKARLVAGVGVIALALPATMAVASAQSSRDNSVGAPADTQESAAAGRGGVADIVVTAQKRAQNLNDVGLSISAIGADEIANRGVTRPEDLAGVVPSLTVTRTQFDSPSYTLRGVGFYDSSLAATTTVSMYVDQVPLVYPIMARGAPMDLERVEVLKGPQGTVFGQNSTGGLVNYIAAKPTSDFKAGVNASYARFGRFDGDAFISGPIAEGVTARLALATTQGGAWQKSATRPSDRLGDQRFTRGRLIVEAEPAETLRLSLMVHGWIDKSDTPAAQSVDDVERVNGQPVGPLLDISTNLQKGLYKNPRIADWDEGARLRRDDDFIQTSLRAELDITPDVTLTSISAYSHLRRDSLNDGDGTAALDLLNHLYGNIDDFSQELRLSGTAIDKRLNWSFGGNYQRSSVDDIEFALLNVDGGGFLIPGFGTFTDDINQAFTRTRSIAAFANAEFELTPALTIYGGVRYTDNRIRFRGCTADSGKGDIASLFGAIQQFALGITPTTAPGECATLLNTPETPPSELYTSGEYVNTLKENNVSWRFGANWKPFGDDTMLYANVSRGFKAGSFPRTGANLSSQLLPVTQEKLTAYEAGFKASLANRTLQINGAGFYYDYRDKQIRGRVVTIFGQLEQLLNIPRSRIWGLELQTFWRPISGLTINATGTYINSRILKNPDGTDYATYPARAHNDDALIPITGSQFPFTPKYSASIDAQYDFAVSGNLNAFIGGSTTYQSRTKSTLTPADVNRPVDIAPSASVTYNDPAFSLRPYTLFNVRLGLKSADDKWNLSAWGRNITNKYYTPAITRTLDTIIRFTGEPATYGVTVGYNF
ncbi:TonB-dependent receptor [Sphingobium chlorophenolicum]|uniref:TonB-dependent receptor n=2 Tax=Sphingobium chlorophenolicum TaxID=46429 RepID=A0A081RFA8_SPHCR|nr:TonB-dependent receptor [Sphingobium chlorophenolicum]KEQ53881.1 TonB-dependent receptor [Sphingobium chlorophenolicum]